MGVYREKQHSPLIIKKGTPAHLFKTDIRAVNIGNEDLLGMRKIKITGRVLAIFSCAV